MTSLATTLRFRIGSRTVTFEKIAPQYWQYFWAPDHPRRLPPAELAQFSKAVSQIDGYMGVRSYDPRMERAVAVSPRTRNRGHW